MEIREGSRLDNLEDEIVEEGQQEDAQAEAPIEKEEEITPEALAGEAVQETESAPEIVPYTPEEIEALLREEDANVDFRRLSPEGQAIFKSVDRGLKPKLEERKELLALKERFESIKQTVGAEKPQQSSIEDEFARNPQGVLANIRQMIAEKQQTDPFGTELAQLQNAHAYFVEKLAVEQYQEANASRARNEALNVVREIIPDFNPAELTDFAINNLGISDEKLTTWTDAAKVGPEDAAMVTSFIHRLYSAEKKLAELSQTQSLPKKEVKSPTQVEDAGTGFQADKPTEWSAEHAINERLKQTLR